MFNSDATALVTENVPSLAVFVQQSTGVAETKKRIREEESEMRELIEKPTEHRLTCEMNVLWKEVAPQSFVELSLSDVFCTVEVRAATSALRSGWLLNWTLKIPEP